MNAPGRWADLRARVASAAVLVLIGLGAVLAGGAVFHGFVVLACGAMVWELMRMLGPDRHMAAIGVAILAAAVLAVAPLLHPLAVVPALLVPCIAAALLQERLRAVALVYGLVILLAGYEFMQVRDLFGAIWMLWLALVVVASDVAGYFAGKALGGPKFWPRISPKKTWSGTIAGWIGAALVGLAFALYLDTGPGLVPFSMLVALAAQMGDIGESAIKRRVGVKDASALIPGHGGLLDRFDGMLGAALFVLLVGAVFDLPLGAG